MRIRLTLIALTLLMGVLVTGCKKTTVTPKTDEELQIEKLTGTWVLQAGSSAVTVDIVNDVTTNWPGFTLTLGNKTYQTSSSPEALIWPSSGTWAFGTSVSTLVRDDGVEISVSVTDTSLQLQFDYSASGGRLNGIEGNWVFKMVPQ
jgi:hypothetical protein